MANNLLECSNCTGYDEGHCPDIEMGMVPEQCQVFDPITALGVYNKIIILRGMKMLATFQILERPSNVSPLSDEELKGLIVDLKT